VAEIWHLVVSTYQGYVPGARHYYGWIKTPDRKEFSLSRSMSSKEIRIANRETKAEGITGDVYRPGSKTHCYDGMDQIEADAIEEFLRRAPEGTVLLRGNPAVVDPQVVLVASAEILARGNDIKRRWEEIDGWEGHRADADAISEEWDELIQEIEKG
jgi:hypothetical protein